MMKVSEIKYEDVYRLIEFMKKTDTVLMSAHGRWSDCFTLECFSPIKAATVVWGRIAETFGFLNHSCLNNMPILEMDEFSEDNGECGESITEYIMSAFDLSQASKDNLSKAGITVVHDLLEPIDFLDFQELAEEAAMEDGEVLTPDEKFNRAVELYKEVCCTEISIDFPGFYRSMVKFACDNEFYSVVYLIKSRRVGRFEQHRRRLMETLPMELYEGISYLIHSVFMPLYCFFPNLTIDGINNSGEYCHVYAMGSFLESDEEVAEIHKRPYADIAVALLDRLLTEAEALVPELLADNDTAGEKVSEVVTVEKSVCVA